MNTKLIVAVVLVGVLAIITVGLVAAQIATANPDGTTANRAIYSGFFGWIGRCLGFKGASYYGTQAPAYPIQAENITVYNPYTGTTKTYQGCYGYGRCGMMGFYP
jgi:hypothetical protein